MCLICLVSQGREIPDSVPQVVHLAVGARSWCALLDWIMTGRIVVAGVGGVWCDRNGFEICSWGTVVDVGCLDTLPRQARFPLFPQGLPWASNCVTSSGGGFRISLMEDEA